MIPNKKFNHNVAWKNEDVAARYDAQRFQSRSGARFHKAEIAVVNTLLDKAEEAVPFQQVLDLPCGTGRISELLAARGIPLTCADISVPMLKVAKDRLRHFRQNINYTEANIYDLAFSDNSFECVTCIRLFQHLTQDQVLEALRELNRVSSGYVIANFMYADGYYAATRRLRKALGRYAPRYTIDRKFLNSVEAKTGLVIVDRQLSQPLHSGNLLILFRASKTVAS